MVVPLTPVRLKRHAARAYGRKIGIVCESLRLTYLEFNERCDRLSQALLKLGLKRGDRVAYLSFNCHRLLEAYYGVPQVGCILLPLNIRLRTEELSYVLNDAAPRVLFFDPEFIPQVEDLRHRDSSVERFIALRGVKPAWAHPQFYDELLAGAEPREIDYRGIDENSVAELFYTSGTTAHPKGVMLTHRNLYLHAFYAAVRLADRDSLVHLYTVPLFHVNSWGAPHIVTLVGGRYVMIRKFDPVSVMELVARERVTRLHGVPTMLIAMLNDPAFSNYDLSSLGEVMLGGAPSSTALIREIEKKLPSAKCLCGYGLTETSPVIVTSHPKARLAGEPDEVRIARQASAGYAIAGAQVRVVDVNGKDVRPDAREV